MDILNQIMGNINSAANRMSEFIVEAMMEVDFSILDLNIQQLKEGTASDGSIVGEYANDEYAIYKQSIGSQAPLGVVDTRLTGDFHSAFYAEPYFGYDDRSTGLFIDSRDSKSESLERKYSNLFGIAPDNTDEVFELIIDKITKSTIDEITKN